MAPAMVDRADAPTIRDVAAAAGVSAATVSNYFHHPERMSDATRRRIGSVVEELGFLPNDGARSLRRGRSPVIGYISYELASARTPAILNAIGDRLALDDLQLLSAVDGGDPGRERGYLALFERQRASGVIISPVTDVEPELARLRSRGLASVLCAQRARSPQQASVSIDHVTGGRLVAEHLLVSGRRDLAFVTDTLERSQLAERFHGVEQAVKACRGATLSVVWTAGRSVAAGADTARTLLQGRSGLPDALLGANDLVAMGLCAGLRGRVVVPDDVAVVGYDDIEFAALGAVPLTTVRTPQEDLGRTAAELLLDEIAAGDDAGSPRPHVELAPELVVRESSLSA
jgi:LacI family transcriptional regulator